MADDNKAGAAATSEGTAGGGTAKTDTTGTTGTAATTGDHKPADTGGTPPADAGTGTATKDDGKAGAETGGKADTAKPESKAPAKYELNVPETAADYVTPETVTRVETKARELGLSNEDAQLWLDELAGDAAESATRALEVTKADKEFGGDHLAETQKLANGVIDRVFPKGHERRDSFLAFMRRTGAGNSIEVVSFLATLGKLIGEDSPGVTRSSGQGGGSAADKLYDHPTSKLEG